MASVEQREASLPAGISTLEMFDKYKVLDEDKDSDEESFHLPLLDSEEDLAINSKPNNTPAQNGETEDDILNKFDCTTPDPVDPKVEDSILSEEIEDESPILQRVATDNQEEDKKSEIVENGVDEAETNNQVTPEVVDNESVTVEKIDDLTPDQDHQKDISLKRETKNANGDDGIPNEEAGMEIELEIKNDTIVNVETSNSEANEKDSVKVETDVKDNKDMDIDSGVKDTKKEIEFQNNESEILMETDEIGTDSNKSSTKKECLTDDKQGQSDVEEKLKVNGTDGKTENILSTEKLKDAEEISESEPNCHKEDNMNAEKMEDENKEECLDTTKADDVEVPKDVTSTLHDLPKEQANKLGELPKEETNEIHELSKDKINKLHDSSSATGKGDENKTEESSKSKASEDSTSVLSQEDDKSVDKSETVEDKSYPEVNESASSENLDRDDLLDISIICDVDEDNAKAVAENATDGQNSEKSDNDDQDDKAENDIEESENDQEENVCSSDKYDPMEFEDSVSNSNLQFEENSSTNDNVVTSMPNEKSNSDSLDSDIGSNKEDVEMVDVLPKVIAGLSKNSHKTLVETTQTEEGKTENGLDSNLNVPPEPVEYLDLDKHMAEQKKALELPQSGKRPLPSEDNREVNTKKIRLSESPTRDDSSKKNESEDKPKTLSSFESFMRTKLFNKTLTKSDLEQFCIQKICEVIMHKTELGELHQMLRKQEQVNDVLRKDIQQLSKQARDLDIVNKKLMNELKTLNGKQKPLVPLKITRSVGLQVKLNITNEQNRKRPPNTPNRVSSTGSTNTPPVNNRQRTVTTNSSVVRQITPNAPSPRKAQTGPNSTTPILSQALQTPASRQASTPVSTPKRSPQVIRPKTTEAAKPSNPGVIDLTDEDDRSSKPSSATPLKILNKPLVATSKLVASKSVGKSPTANQSKVVSLNQVKAGQVLSKGTPTRTVTTLPQGVRLTPTGVKNGIAIPANVVTSSTGGAQLMYVVQPTSSLVTTTAQGGQKTVLLNFQPSNGILTSALNGSAVSVIPTKANVQVKTSPAPRKHPAPLPLPPPIQPNNNLKPLLPKPHLSIRKTETGIILQWRMPYNLDLYECIASYQLFAYQETNAPPSTDMWRKVGDVKALALPMACTLTQFADKNKYYFAVRSVDVHKRIGAFSDPEEISL